MKSFKKPKKKVVVEASVESVVVAPKESGDKLAELKARRPDRSDAWYARNV
jgi:hypothetical protein